MRILVISDIHGNQAALETVLSAAAGRYDTVWCLGDVVGYGPRPNECVDLVREHASFCAMGNHDWAVLGRPGINVDDFNPQARQAVLWTQEQLTADNRTFLDAMVDHPVRPLPAAPVLATHASPREPVWEYVLTPSTALENFAEFTEDLCLVGHTHKPAIFRWRLQERPALANGAIAAKKPLMATVEYLQPRADCPIELAPTPVQRLIVNPGSVGQPRDNDARAAYAILDLESMIWEYVRVPYPIELTQSQMRAARLPKRLIDRLGFGW